jgi:pseudaminic acid synthase
MVKAIRQAEQTIGIISYNLTESAITNQKFGRSLFVVKDIKAGELFTEENIRSIRPGVGMHPKYMNEILGATAKRDFKRGEPLIG